MNDNIKERATKIREEVVDGGWGYVIERDLDWMLNTLEKYGELDGLSRSNATCLVCGEKNTLTCIFEKRCHRCKRRSSARHGKGFAW